MSRSLTAAILNRFATSHRNLDDIVNEQIDQALRSRTTGFSPPQVGRVRLLVHATVKHQGAFDQVLKIFSSVPPEEMERHVRTVFRLALAELTHLPRTRHATVVDEAVNLAGVAPPETEGTGERGEEASVASGFADAGDPMTALVDAGTGIDDNDEPRPEPRRETRQDARAAQHARARRGFVNGLLRAITRAIKPVEGEALSSILNTGEIPRDVLIAPGAAGGPLAWRFDRGLFADPDKKPATYLAQAYSLPRWLVERWITRHGYATARDVAWAALCPPALTLRVNRMRTSADALATRLRDEHGIATEPVDGLPFGLRVAHGQAAGLFATPAFRDGLFYAQDATSQQVIEAAALTAGQFVIDGCAAPGGKITHAFEVMGGQGRFLALDASPSRLERVRENVARLCGDGDAIETAESPLEDFAATFADQPDEHADVVLVDAPCSNTGVLSRRVDARWRLQPGDFAKLADLQSALLAAAMRLTKPRGRVIYSTCTLEPEELRAVVDRALATTAGFTLADETTTLPKPRHYDGGYRATLTRT